MSKWFLVICYSLFAAGWGVYRGEDIIGGPAGMVFDLVLVVVWGIVGWRLALSVFGGHLKSVLLGIALSGVFVGSYFAGQREAQLAFNDCNHRGESVRASLGAYYQEHGSYPSKLSHLKMSNLPGDRILRRNLLEYSRIDEGYELKYCDWLVVHRASDSIPFAANKR